MSGSQNVDASTSSTTRRRVVVAAAVAVLAVVAAGLAWVAVLNDPAETPEDVAVTTTDEPSPVPHASPSPSLQPSPVPAPAPVPEPAPEPSPVPPPEPSPPRPPTSEGAPSAPVDCSVAPAPGAFSVGAVHDCFSTMDGRLRVWLGANTACAGPSPVADDVFGEHDQTNVMNAQRLMGADATGWLDQTQWARLLTAGPPPVTELRTSGIGPLWVGMSAAQVAASGVATVEDPPPGVADPAYTSVVIPDASAQACVGSEGLYAVLVKHPSPVRTVEGITTQSSVDDLRAAFGERLVTRTVDYVPDWVDYAVYDGQVGYAFVPQDDGSLMLIAGTRQLVDSVAGGPHGIC